VTRTASGPLAATAVEVAATAAAAVAAGWVAAGAFEHPSATTMAGAARAPHRVCERRGGLLRRVQTREGWQPEGRLGGAAPARAACCGRCRVPVWCRAV